MKPLHVIVCGAGIAGLEGLLRLRALAGDAVRITLISPGSHVDFRPAAVHEPFGVAPQHHLPLSQVASDLAITWHQDALHWVDRHERRVHTRGGLDLGYDALLLAVGGLLRPTDPHMDVFTSDGGADTFLHVIDEIDAGTLYSLAFVIPDGPHWLLPLYELALLTARHASERGRPLRIHLVTAERRPLDVFGGPASATIEDLLYRAGVELIPSSLARMPYERRLLISPLDHRELQRPITVERTLTVPLIAGPDVQGVPGDGQHRFIPVTPWCRVKGVDGIWAAGDGTNSPVKHGAIGAQQADVAAADIAHVAGVGPRPEPLRPVLRGKLVTGAEPVYLFAHLIAGRGWNAELTRTVPWTTDEELVAVELGRYLRRAAARPTSSA